jgi:hypothetical protein
MDETWRYHKRRERERERERITEAAEDVNLLIDAGRGWVEVREERWTSVLAEFSNNFKKYNPQTTITKIKLLKVSKISVYQKFTNSVCLLTRTNKHVQAACTSCLALARLGVLDTEPYKSASRFSSIYVFYLYENCVIFLHCCRQKKPP